MSIQNYFLILLLLLPRKRLQHFSFCFTHQNQFLSLINHKVGRGLIEPAKKQRRVNVPGFPWWLRKAFIGKHVKKSHLCEIHLHVSLFFFQSVKNISFRLPQPICIHTSTFLIIDVSLSTPHTSFHPQIRLAANEKSQMDPKINSAKRKTLARSQNTPLSFRAHSISIKQQTIFANV